MEDQGDIKDHILSFSCPDQLGVVARTTGLLYESGAFVTEISNYSDPVSKTFHMRCVFDDRHMTSTAEEFDARFKELAANFQMAYRFRLRTEKPRVLIAVSRYDHCLSALLSKWKSGALPAEIVGILSNHEDCRFLAESYEIPYFYFPVTPSSKTEQELKFRELIDDKKIDLLVLARYMQILSQNFCDSLKGQVINIHHSFLPGFKGAKPYHQAYERGVKVIGATAHYVTPELDDGPIIVQEVRPITHETTADQMVYLGHDIEATALSVAVRLHCDERVQINGQRTVIL
ncbi:MAG: formyltetrahydrofolate deformylase [Gammaproteobacteria bacterium]|nr:formyltetrahydrofolate deformylase [Gammaproteobacteria bacterium]